MFAMRKRHHQLFTIPPTSGIMVQQSHRHSVDTDWPGLTTTGTRALWRNPECKVSPSYSTKPGPSTMGSLRIFDETFCPSLEPNNMEKQPQDRNQLRLHHADTDPNGSVMSACCAQGYYLLTHLCPFCQMQLLLIWF